MYGERSLTCICHYLIINFQQVFTDASKPKCIFLHYATLHYITYACVCMYRRVYLVDLSSVITDNLLFLMHSFTGIL